MDANQPKHNYKKISMYYLVGTMFNKGISFLTVPIFTRLLDTNDYGIINTYNSWVSILSIVVSCALYMGIRSAFIDYDKKIDDVMASVTTFTIGNGLLITAIVMVVSRIANLPYPSLLILLCMIHSVGAGLIQNYSMYLMMQYRFRFRTVLLVLPNLLSVVISLFAILFVIKSQLYMGRIVPTAIIQGMFGVLIVILVYRKSHDLFDTTYLKFTLGLSLPLVLHGIALNILSQSDRLMITSLRSFAETGVYSLVYNFGMIATVIITAMDGVWVPWFTNKLKQNAEKDINARAKTFIGFMTLAMIALIMLGPEIIKLLADQKYWEGIKIVPPIVLANFSIFAYTLYVNIEHYYKKTKYITINTLIAAGCNIITNLIFIPRYGYVAAAYTTLFSYLVALIAHAAYSRKLNKELYPLYYFIFPGVFLLISTFAFYFLIELPVVRWGITIAICIIVFILERKTIKALLLNGKKL